MQDNKKQPIIENVADMETEKETHTLIEKLDFEDVFEVMEVMRYSFHPEGIDENTDVKEAFLTAWRTYLMLAGWAEDQFWEEMTNRSNHEHCPHCGNIVDSNDEDMELSPTSSHNANEHKPN